MVEFFGDAARRTSKRSSDLARWGIMEKATNGEGVLIVIPSSIRAMLACNAIRPVLDQTGNDAKISVSDDSIMAEEADRLGKFCDGLKNARVRRVRINRRGPLGSISTHFFRRAR
jgi:hypothetical protein